MNANEAFTITDRTIFFMTRVAASESVAGLRVKVLGSPVQGAAAQLELSGVEGQAVNPRLVDLQGKAIHEQRIEQASSVEPVSVSLGRSRVLLLKENTDSQQQSVNCCGLSYLSICEWTTNARAAKSGRW